jgi:hypothetical protein
MTKTKTYTLKNTKSVINTIVKVKQKIFTTQATHRHNIGKHTKAPINKLARC